LNEGEKMNIQEISKEVKKVAQEILAERKYQVGHTVKLKKDIEGPKNQIWAKKGDKVKILKAYTLAEAKELGYDYEVKTENNHIIDIEWSDLE
jgi:hypothetical protein